MGMLRHLEQQYGNVDCRDLGSRQLELLRDGLKDITPEEIVSAEEGNIYIDLLRKFREAVAENDKLHGENYPQLLNSLLSVGEDGLYSNSLRFIFELIQNVDDCDFPTPEDCRLDVRFDFNKDEIILTYNEVGFTPFNVFAITGIAEAAKNISASKNEIGEKGIGFKSVFGVAKKVLIQSGFFSFELYKENFTIPVAAYSSSDNCPGTRMTLYVPGKAEQIYREIKKQYCRKEALFSRNPLLFLNKLTTLKMYFDSWRSMEFHVSRSGVSENSEKTIERDVEIAVSLHDYDSSGDYINDEESIRCARYSYPVVFSQKACQSRYGELTTVGKPDGKPMTLRVLFPYPEYLSDVGTGALYSFLPTQLKLSVPMVCHVPFKLDASREFVDPQDENLWFREACTYLSDLIDYAYMDWRNEVEADIAKYLPGKSESIFAFNNGKEHCLRRRSELSGSHYLSLPLFYTADGAFHKAEEIYCFEPREKVLDPERVHRLLGYQRFLFNPSCPVDKFGFATIRNVYDNLFKRALSNAAVTAEALEYLDSVEYSYPEKQLREQTSLEFTYEQIEIVFKHKKLASILQKIGNESLQKGMRYKLNVTGVQEERLTEVLSSYDEDFQLSDVPRKVERYLEYCEGRCICLDIGSDDYLPCHNAVALSKKDPMASFAALCYAVDQTDTFSIRVKWREASKKLNQVVEDARSASDYLRDLRNLRRVVKDSLGDRGYKNYTDLILKSGTDKGRFIQELLQNADDCTYAKDVTPSFTLYRKGNTVIAEYNETGFTRANIRSITAIGESTKNMLVTGQLDKIGEKGVGFKTVFAVASEVRIHSGEFHFALTYREPTIPSELRNPAQRDVTGTRMELVLKDTSVFPEYSDRTVLELCLCLRQLRSIQIGAHTVSIADADDYRTITINKRQHVFKRVAHRFSITDAAAMKERENGTQQVSSEQTIFCYVAEKGGLSDYALYCGLPTKHRIKIPMVIDAPFALTTSREEIEQGNGIWNSIIRKEMYEAIWDVIDTRKRDDRSKVLRFTRFLPRRYGSETRYDNDISDCSFITEYDYKSTLKSRMVLPTFDKNVFAIPNERSAFRFPEVANLLFRMMPSSEYAGIRASSIIDAGDADYVAALNALDCPEASFRQVFPIIRKHAEEYIENDEFRTKLYEYLLQSPVEYKEELKQYDIIPVYGKMSGSVEYICWIDDAIFVKKGAQNSGPDYYVLAEDILSKAACESIFGTNINEMNAEWERSRYNERLNKMIHGNSIEEIYKKLLAEFRSGALQRNESFPTLFAVSDLIPYKNELGEIVDTPVFLCDQPSGYFPVRMIQKMIAHRECAEFARCMRCSELSGIHYDDISYNEPLTADDIEVLLDDYFANSEEILRGFHRHGLISNELLCEYGLEYFAFGRIAMSDGENNYSFPDDPVKDRGQLIAHIRKLWAKPVRIVSVTMERSVRRGQNDDGSTFDLGINDAREGALKTYAPLGSYGVCFCQMCGELKPQGWIEVNNIELLPDYYFPQTRIALCLECSQKFKALRNNETIRERFQQRIRSAVITDQGTIAIPIGNEDTVRFTAKHLAEIQEIFKQGPED